MFRRKFLLYFFVFVLVIAAALVLIGNVATAHTNPPITFTAQWDSPETEALARRACFACHSNETRWPWYSYVAPANFLVVKDVNDGRRKMNFSSGGELEGDEMIEQIERGKMPPAVFLPLHPEANLSEAEKAQLIQGLRKTFGG